MSTKKLRRIEIFVKSCVRTRHIRRPNTTGILELRTARFRCFKKRKKQKKKRVENDHPVPNVVFAGSARDNQTYT